MKIVINLEKESANLEKIEKIASIINNADKIKTDRYFVRLIDSRHNFIAESYCTTTEVNNKFLNFLENSISCSVIWKLIAEIVIDEDAQVIQVKFREREWGYDKMAKREWE
ncbi:MAG TPA: hypothetical protein ENG48_12830 [Candidatus Atribacteria bacterium]|nr:hypothetical protein [Candidatus Atribacteria bacterium]